MKAPFVIILFFLGQISFAQDTTSVISLAEYLGYVKAYHPIVKQAGLVVSESESKLMKARGAFDPKIEVDYQKKAFKNTVYYDKLNAAFKIPTWYGIEFKGAFEENSGIYLNPENNLPQDGLYSVGVSVSLAQGLLANKRMTMLKQGKLFVKQAKADRQLLVNEVLYEATLAYFNWLKTYNEKKVYEEFLTNAQMRFNGIKTSFESGDKPAIDTVEARIALNDRKLNLEKSNIKYIKASLELSNYLWLNNNTPIEITPSIIPDTNTIKTVDATLNASPLNTQQNPLGDHPKLQSLDLKFKSLTLEKRLAKNNLLPKIDLQYNFLSQTPEMARSFSTSAYKSGLSIYVPLFLRKERGDLKLVDLKLQDARFEIINTQTALRNKIQSISQELESFVVQDSFMKSIVKDYTTMFKAEERKFFLGESSLFLVNSRESKLIDAKLKAIELENRFFNTKAKFFNVTAGQLLE